jgi:hypothetical protein
MILDFPTECSQRKVLEVTLIDANDLFFITSFITSRGAATTLFVRQISKKLPLREIELQYCFYIPKSREI